MSFAIRAALPADLPALAALAAECQTDPQRHCGYVSDDATSIARDVEEVADWPASTLVALDDARSVIGWVLAETDPDMTRVWWFGPFVTNADDRDVVAGALLRRGIENHPNHDQHELAVDQRSTLFAELAAQHGFARQEGSLVLRLDDVSAAARTSPRVAPVGEGSEHGDAVAALHDQTFPGTHSSGTMLLRDHRCRAPGLRIAARRGRHRLRRCRSPE